MHGIASLEWVCVCCVCVCVRMCVCVPQLRAITLQTELVLINPYLHLFLNKNYAYIIMYFHHIILGHLNVPLLVCIACILKHCTNKHPAEGIIFEAHNIHALCGTCWIGVSSTPMVSSSVQWQLPLHMTTSRCYMGSGCKEARTMCINISDPMPLVTMTSQCSYIACIYEYNNESIAKSWMMYWHSHRCTYGESLLLSLWLSLQ